MAAVVLMAPTAGAAAPCGAHKGGAKVACVKQLKIDRALNSHGWPKKATDANIRRRVGAYNWSKALRVARCETGTNWRHFPNGTYIGGLGMFRTTYGYGQRKTGYRWPSQGATKAEQIAVAVAAHPITYGWGGWRGCRNA